MAFYIKRCVIKNKVNNLIFEIYLFTPSKDNVIGELKNQILDSSYVFK